MECAIWRSNLNCVVSASVLCVPPEKKVGVFGRTTNISSMLKGPLYCANFIVNE